MGICSQTGAGNRSKYVDGGKCNAGTCSNCGKCNNSECSNSYCNGCGGTSNTNSSNSGCSFFQWGVILIIALFYFISEGC